VFESVIHLHAARDLLWAVCGLHIFVVERETLNNFQSSQWFYCFRTIVWQHW